MKKRHWEGVDTDVLVRVLENSEMKALPVSLPNAMEERRTKTRDKTD